MIRLIPSNILDAGALEQWREETHAGGHALRDMGQNLAYFDRCAPALCRYRFQAADQSRPLEDEQLALYEELGWDYVTDLGAIWHIFRCADPTAPELDTDPVVQGYHVERLYRRECRTLVLCLAAAFLAAGYLLWSVASDTAPVELLLTKLPVLALLALLLALAAGEAVSQLRFCAALRRKLSAGVPAEHRGPWRSYRVQARSFLGLEALLILLAVCYPFYQIAAGENLYLSETTEPLPYVAAANLDPALSPADRFVGSAYLDTELLIPKRYEVWEAYPEQINVHTYLDCLRFDCTVEPLYREKAETLRRQYPGGRGRWFTVPGFDQIFLLQGDTSQALLARQGRRILTVTVNFPVDLSAHLEEYAAILTAFS